MFDFTSVHLCQKHIIEMGKLGCFGLCFVRSLLRKQPSLFDVRFLMYAVNTYIKVEFDVEYFQWYVSKTIIISLYLRFFWLFHGTSFARWPPGKLCWSSCLLEETIMDCKSKRNPPRKQKSEIAKGSHLGWVCFGEIAPTINLHRVVRPLISSGPKNFAIQTLTPLEKY